MLAPLAYLSGDRVSLKGTLRAPKAYTDTTDLLEKAFPELTIEVTNPMIRTSLWNEKVGARIMENWGPRLVNENLTRDGLIVGDGYLDREGIRVTEEAKSLDSVRAAAEEILDLSGLGEVTLDWTDPGTGRVYHLVKDYLTGLTEIDLTGTDLTEVLEVTKNPGIQEIVTQGSVTSLDWEAAPELTTVSLGAPSIIKGSGSEQATLSVQSMMRCRELVLGEGATSEGSIATAARLLGQLREELETPSQTCLRVGFKDSGAALAWCNPDNGSMWQSGEEVTVEGLRLFIVRDKIMEAYALVHDVDVESVSDEEAMAWAYDLCEDTAEDDGNIPVKDEFVFWSCSEGKEGDWADILLDGTVKGKYFLGSVRGALRANPQEAFCELYLPLGLGNAEDSEDYPLAQSLLSIKDKFNNETLLNFIIEYNVILSTITKQPGLADCLIEYPPLINSLVDTGKRNIITQVTGSTAGIINSDIVCSDDMSFRYIANRRTDNSTYWVFGGGGSSGSGRMNSYFISGSGGRVSFRYSSTENNKIDTNILNRWGEYKFDINSYSVLGIETSRVANISSFVSKDVPIHIFGYMNDNGGYSRNTNSLGDIFSLEVLEIRKNNEQHKFVPYIKEGENGLLDLYDLSFHGNVHTSGEFTIESNVIKENSINE